MEFQVARPTHQALLSTEPSHLLNSNKKSLTLYIENFVKNLQSRLAQIATGIQCIHSQQMNEVSGKKPYMWTAQNSQGCTFWVCVDFFAKDCFLCGPAHFCKVRISSLLGTLWLHGTPFSPRPIGSHALWVVCRVLLSLLLITFLCPHPDDQDPL